MGKFRPILMIIPVDNGTCSHCHAEGPTALFEWHDGTAPHEICKFCFIERTHDIPATVTDPDALMIRRRVIAMFNNLRPLAIG